MKIISYAIIIIVGVIIGLVAFSYAGSDLKSSRGETGYVKVAGIGENFISTSENDYVISKGTSFHDDEGKIMTIGDIKISSMVRILYKGVNGQLIAVDVIVKKPISKLPE